MTKKKKNIICSALFFLFGAFLMYESLPIKPMVGKDLGSGYVPKIVAVAIMVVAAIEMFVSLRDRTSEKEEKKESSDTSDTRGGLLTIALICAYVALYGELGFVISTALYLFLQMNIFSTKENRKIVLYAVVSIAATLIIYVVFNNIIGMQLPAGILDF